MHLAQIKLRDWKAFASANFQLPNPSNNKNIILIGAPNGYGKTSLFEAIILALYGRDGLPFISGSPIPIEGEGKKDIKSYSKYMERTLHRGAIDRTEKSCSVKLIFIDKSDEPLEIRRTWHFSETGRFLPQDEQVEIYDRISRTPVDPNRIEISEQRDWYQEFIAKRILPLNLSRFFMFDGEQVGILAEREMSGQVRQGIESLLGIPLLKQLASNLRDYAEQRARTNYNVSDSTIKNLQTELNSKIKKRDSKREYMQNLESDLFDLNSEREKLVNEVASYGTGTQALLQEKIERMQSYEKNIEQHRTQLEDLLVEDIALALTGANIQKSVIDRMNSENVRERWENAKNQGDKNLDKFLKIFMDSLDDLNPELTSNQKKNVSTKIKNAWENLWFPPPPDCANSIIHGYLKDSDRANIIDNLTDITTQGVPNIVEILNVIETNTSNLKKLQDEVKRTESIAPQVDEKIGILNELNDKIQENNRETGEIRREIEGYEGQINNLNAELSKMMNHFEEAKPSVRRISRANKVASLIDDIVIEAVPSQIDAIAREMTDAHKFMSHKKDLIDKIEISKNCDVKLLSTENTDLRKYSLSAGEKQIFTQSLLSAVTSVSQRSFPLVIDTPLGRLDVEHRKGLLNHLKNRDGQVVLLSTNTEIVGEYLKVIEQNIQKKFKLHYKKVGEIGVTDVHEGYFEEEEESI